MRGRQRKIAATCHLWAALLLAVCLHTSLADALPDKKRINSVKSLTHTLSLVEKEHGDKGRFVTMKLQIYLEDVYISQGTAIVIKPGELSQAIDKLLDEGVATAVAAKTILKRYKDGEFHEK